MSGKCFSIYIYIFFFSFRSADTRGIFIDTINRIFPGWEDIQKVLVSDREFKNDQYFRGNRIHNVVCWNHLLKNMQRKAKDLQLGLNRVQNSVLKANFYHLLNSESEARFYEKLDSLIDGTYTIDGKAKPIYEGFQNPQFVEYLRRHMIDDIMQHAIRFRLEEYGFTNLTNTGITNNAAESLNNSLEKFLNRQDTLTWYKGSMTIYHFMRTFDRDVERAYHNSGELLHVFLCTSLNLFLLLLLFLLLYIYFLIHRSLCLEGWFSKFGKTTP